MSRRPRFIRSRGRQPPMRRRRPGGHGPPDRRDGGGYYSLSWLFEPHRRFYDAHRPGFFHYGQLGFDGDDEASGPSAIGRPGEPRPKPDPADKDVLQVENVDFRVADNARTHHTDEYDLVKGPRPQLVVRRGLKFTMQIDFSRPYDTQKDDLRLVFEIGEQPKASKGTQVEFVLSDKDEEDQWGAKIAGKSNKSLVVDVFTPPDCIVGKWSFKVHVVRKTNNQTSVFCYNHRNPIYLLFNPWCRADTVFMEKADDIKAYVMKDEGKIYSGNSKRITPKPWVFGQFSGHVLECCMDILDMSEMSYTARGNPILVVRKLTAMVNSQDDDGVLTGNWSGNYSGGKSPLSWTGSAAILEQFYRDKRPVRFGQCWVFSGVLTAVCRSLGIPARSVTNFASAHDVDSSITIDLHFDSNGESLEHQNEDSIWNFHVWNEVWMARPDLPAGYGGWQACDATPQETSDGVYCCGPCPVRAIREGEVNLPYDGPFIFAEVNADRVYWLQQEDGSWKNVYSEPNTVGKHISTLAKNDQAQDPREDVTNLYKYPEGSAEERVAVRKANLVGSKRKNIYQSGPKDVEFKLTFDEENSWVGQDFVLKLVCKNTSDKPRTIHGRCAINTMYYTGVVAEQVVTQKLEGLQLKPGENKSVEVLAQPDKYFNKLKDCCMLSLSTLAKVQETSQIFTTKDDARLRKPHLNIKGPKEAIQGSPINVEFSFTNPLKETLTDCYLEVDGPGLKGVHSYPQSDVAGKGTFFANIQLTPANVGAKEIVAIFNSRQLEDINSSFKLTVKARREE